MIKTQKKKKIQLVSALTIAEESCKNFNFWSFPFQKKKTDMHAAEN